MNRTWPSPHNELVTVPVAAPTPKNHAPTMAKDPKEPHVGLLGPFSHMEQVNRAMMATAPEGFVGCVNQYVPAEADVLLMSFNEMCLSVSPWLQP